MSIEAMKQALEALEQLTWAVSHPDNVKIGKEGQATLRTAIEAAEKQEPVAWMHTGGHVQVRNPTWADGIADRYTRDKGWKPLYTTPPAAQPAPVQDEFLLRGILASELKCWHRLTEDEEINLLAFVKNMAPKPAPVQEPYKGWYCAHCQRNVDPKEVTYHEQHTVCGRVITDDTLPAAQRQWVSLTEEQREGIAKEWRGRNWTVGNIIDAVEDKLREKNGGQA